VGRDPDRCGSGREEYGNERDAAEGSGHS